MIFFNFYHVGTFLYDQIQIPYTYLSVCENYRQYVKQIIAILCNNVF